MNQIQVINTHNSYKREIGPAEQATYDLLTGKPGDYAGGIAYSHASLAQQFAGQDVRGIELDLWPIPMAASMPSRWSAGSSASAPCRTPRGASRASR